MEDGWTTQTRRTKAAPPSREDKLSDARRHWGAAQNYVRVLEGHAKPLLNVKDWMVRPAQDVEGDKTPTICFLVECRDDQQDQFRSRHEFSRASAERHALKELRDTVGIANKATICAEENFATTYPKLIEKCVYSISFDKYGRKKACSNCIKILQHYGVSDLDRPCP